MTKCSFKGCGGAVIDGFCEDCGRSPTVEVQQAVLQTVSVRASGFTSRVTGARRPSALSHSTVGSSSNASGRSTKRGSSRGSSSRRRALGGGLVQMPIIPSSDPLLKIMANPRIPDSKCYCSVCPPDANGVRKKVNPDKTFCPNCRTPYNFKPALSAGDVVAGQYEIKGPMAFGGLGWIYLGMDLKLNRWVVLKGLLNTKDEASALAAAEEKKFLSAVKHGKIVGIYNFVNHKSESYIVMEYVGGKTLKEIRKENGLLSPEQAISYILGILPAFGYLHEQGFAYMDFKPDNVLQEGEDVKLIDMGAVRKIDDPNGDVYTTVGYHPPELDDKNPDATFTVDTTTDLYTIARALMVLMIDFPLTGTHRYTVPSPNELMFTIPSKPFDDANIGMAKYSATLKDGKMLPTWITFNPDTKTFFGTAPNGISSIEVTVKAANTTKIHTQDFIINLPFAATESLYRFCLKATDKNPDLRYQNAEEMAGQLLGILREIVVKKGIEIPRFESAEFMHERNVHDAVSLLKGSWMNLPILKMDQEDEAASEVFSAGNVSNVGQRVKNYVEIIKNKPKSSEACLRLADFLIEQHVTNTKDFELVMKYLDAAMAVDPFDWRPDWYAGKLYLSMEKYKEAVECFDKVYHEMPGELTPKLALALALEGAGRIDEATIFYDVVSKIDHSFSMAAFGLARCHNPNKIKILEAYGRITPESATYAQAQLIMINVLVKLAPVSVEDIVKASDIFKTVKREDIARYETEADFALTIAVSLENIQTFGKVSEILGIKPKQPSDFKLHAEHALRLCARQAQDKQVRIHYVERANTVRPLTLF